MMTTKQTSAVCAAAPAPDASAGYARGSILSDSAAEQARYRHAQHLTRQRLASHGPDSIGIFTGNARDYPVRPDDARDYCEEWVGLARVAEPFEAALLAHLAGAAGMSAGAVNRTTAGLIAAVTALADGRPVLSVVPAGGREHAGVRRGAAIAGVPLVVREASSAWDDVFRTMAPRLVVVTTVTSRLECLDDAAITGVIQAARRAGAVVLLDDAYGARFRPVVMGGTPGLSLGAHLVITNCDKAGLSGPRCGLLAGETAWVRAVMTRASEWGMEARAPVIVGALRALERYDPQGLRHEIRQAAELTQVLRDSGDFPALVATPLGPMFDEQTVVDLVAQRAAAWPSAYVPVPAEITSALGACLLASHGILTTNTHGQPGANIAVRLKPTHDALPRVGGCGQVLAGLRAALDAVAEDITDPRRLRRRILGE